MPPINPFKTQFPNGIDPNQPGQDYQAIQKKLRLVGNQCKKINRKAAKKTKKTVSQPASPQGYNPVFVSKNKVKVPVAPALIEAGRQAREAANRFEMAGEGSIIDTARRAAMLCDPSKNDHFNYFRRRFYSKPKPLSEIYLARQRHRVVDADFYTEWLEKLSKLVYLNKDNPKQLDQIVSHAQQIYAAATKKGQINQSGHDATLKILAKNAYHRNTRASLKLLFDFYRRTHRDKKFSKSYIYEYWINDLLAFGKINEVPKVWKRAEGKLVARDYDHIRIKVRNHALEKNDKNSNKLLFAFYEWTHQYEKFATKYTYEKWLEDALRLDRIDLAVGILKKAIKAGKIDRQHYRRKAFDLRSYYLNEIDYKHPGHQHKTKKNADIIIAFYQIGHDQNLLRAFDYIWWEDFLVGQNRQEEAFKKYMEAHNKKILRPHVEDAKFIYGKFIDLGKELRDKAKTEKEKAKYERILKKLERLQKKAAQIEKAKRKS